MRGNRSTKRSISYEGRKNRAIKPSCRAKNLLMAHIHIRKLRGTKENLSDKAITSPFCPWFCPESSPFHLSSAPPTLVRQGSH